MWRLVFIMQVHKFNDPEVQQVAEYYGWKYAGVLNNCPNVPHIHMWCKTAIDSEGKEYPTKFMTEEDLLTQISAML